MSGFFCQSEVCHILCLSSDGCQVYMNLTYIYSAVDLSGGRFLDFIYLFKKKTEGGKRGLVLW